MVTVQMEAAEDAYLNNNNNSKMIPMYRLAI